MLRRAPYRGYLKEGYTVRQLGDALRGRSVQEKSELWITGKIREEMTAELAALWLQQHEAVNRYVMTSTDQFLNIRGGAGVGKTYFMERLVRASLASGRPAALGARH